MKYCVEDRDIAYVCPRPLQEERLGDLWSSVDLLSHQVAKGNRQDPNLRGQCIQLHSAIVSVRIIALFPRSCQPPYTVLATGVIAFTCSDFTHLLY